MKERLFPTRKPPLVQGLSEEDIKWIIDFTRPSFGCSNWNTRASGEWRPYYFNLDQSMGSEDKQKIGLLLDKVSNHVRLVISHPDFQQELDGKEPVLGYVCSSEAPTGIVQMRSALAERLGLRSILIYPDKRLLRARVICDGRDVNFPESVQWLGSRHVLLLTDATTTGESLASAKGTLGAFGVSVLAAVAIFERDEKARECLERIDIPLYPIYTAKRFIELRKDQDGDQSLLQKMQDSTGQERTAVRDFSATIAMAS